MRLHSSYCGYSPVQKKVTSSPPSFIVTAQTSHHQRPVVPKRLFGAYLSQSLILSATVHLADTQPHSPTTLAYESITHTTTTGSSMLSMAKLIMHRHVRIIFLRFPFSTWLT